MPRKNRQRDEDDEGAGWQKARTLAIIADAIAHLADFFGKR